MKCSHSRIVNVDAYQVFDSRGNPTVEATVTLEDHAVGRGTVPSGASTGRYEACELRDGPLGRFRGKGVQLAVDHILGEIRAALFGSDPRNQAEVDACLVSLDATPNRARIGANAILAVSMAYSHALSVSQGIPLFASLGAGQGDLIPIPEIQLVGGGAHAARAIDLQDFMIVALRAGSFFDALEVTFHVYRAAEDLLRSRGKLCGVADEGGFWPTMSSNQAVLDFVLQAIQHAGYSPGTDVAISLDVAASDLFQDGKYRLPAERREFNSEQFAQQIIRWSRDYPICSIEDPMDQDDWPGWQRITEEIGGKVQIVGDDLFTTNLARIEMGIERKLANAVLIKPNQIGTVTETLQAIRLTQSAGWSPIVSARSGETEDTFISHLAVATNAGQLKVGSFSRSERMAKWNEILRIQRLLGAKCLYAGNRSQPEGR